MPSMTLEELIEEAAASADAEPEGEFDEEDTEDEPEVSFHEKLIEALNLLKKSAILFDYVSDRDLCKTLSVRERSAMERMSNLVNDFCEDVANTFAEEDEE